MNLNQKLPSYLLGKYQLIGTVTFSVLFAIVFLNIYIPFSDTAWFALGDSALFQLTAVFVLVSVLMLIASRLIMYQMKKVFDITYLGYTLWCIIEIIMICGFYTGLTVNFVESTEPVREIFGRALLYVTVALGMPYLISGMYFAIIDKNNTIKLMSYENVVTDEPVDAEEQKITLFDNNGTLKLSVSLSNLFFIESDDNYIKVWYSDNKGEMKNYILRCRLKTVEESFKGSPLVRCNRKYIVNLLRVRVLRKENEGYVMDLDNEDIPPIPVTKTYNDIVLARFAGHSPLLEPLDY